MPLFLCLLLHPPLIYLRLISHGGLFPVAHDGLLQHLGMFQDGVLLLGELSLNGEIGPVRGVLEIVSHAGEYGCRTVIVPDENLAEGSVPGNVTVLGARNLNQVIHFLAERSEGAVYPMEESSYEPPLVQPPPLRTMKVDTAALYREQRESSDVDFFQIQGQALMRRAAEIAVSGFHNLLMIGPPGAGKSMTAKRGA